MYTYKVKYGIQILQMLSSALHGPQHEKTCLWWFENIKGVEQLGHPRSLTSTFVILLLESIICGLATSDISKYYLVSVAEQVGLNLNLSETLKTCFLMLLPT